MLKAPLKARHSLPTAYPGATARELGQSQELPSPRQRGAQEERHWLVWPTPRMKRVIPKGHARLKATGSPSAKVNQLPLAKWTPSAGPLCCSLRHRAPTTYAGGIAMEKLAQTAANIPCPIQLADAIVPAHPSLQRARPEAMARERGQAHMLPSLCQRAEREARQQRVDSATNGIGLRVLNQRSAKMIVHMKNFNSLDRAASSKDRHTKARGSNGVPKVTLVMKKGNAHAEGSQLSKMTMTCQ